MPGSPPDYGSIAYWENRFASELNEKESLRNEFEWLGDGSSTLLPALTEHLQVSSSAAKSFGVLNIGCGNSALHVAVRSLYEQHGLDFGQILNLDYSASALKAASVIEQRAFPSQSNAQEHMTYKLADLLQWSSLNGALQNRVFDAILDKSTADAIATAAEVVLLPIASVSAAAAGLAYQESLCPLLPLSLRSYMTLPPTDTRIAYALPPDAKRIHPVRLLAVHLAAVVKPGGIWLILSYSSIRCEFLQDSAFPEDELAINRLWVLDRTVPLEVEDASGSAFAPKVQHWCYALRRRDHNDAL
ncbi:hypothetical protein K437DRAFT_258092 [Tilletiaria anomala UBC 951]|uniref:Methyltransferase domain-containing protein n=1 Tax=Tilletiaria anomala (strain ATCC 24038 / CBS 436.72 / UBC 951) TaxID=1037660 RepID=A0A066VTK6_TILAU|nr:uncharacterized protein K437DRAFT_258092 [Tilletiaria anomala UBC 951]KDN41870.1 hypothetical protein K437DRAFT_258092 [Tilletiaria anomala UBC 951]